MSEPFNYRRCSACNHRHDTYKACCYGCTSDVDAYRYSIHNGTRKPVEPRESWQQAEYERVMGHEPPNLSLPQFDYNPRTKAGKALLEELTHDENVS